MSDDDVLNSNVRIKGAMDELMKTEEGRELAGKLKAKLKELSDQFEGMKVEEKKEFLNTFRKEFSSSLGDVKDKLKLQLGEKVDGEFRLHDDGDGSIPSPLNYAPQPNYTLFLVAVLLIVMIIG